MKGTNKQIEWADNIIGDNIRKLRSAYNENKERALELLELRLVKSKARGKVSGIKSVERRIALMKDMNTVFDYVLNADAAEIIRNRGHISSDNLIEDRDDEFFEEDSHVWSLITQCSALCYGFAEEKYRIEY